MISIKNKIDEIKSSSGWTLDSALKAIQDEMYIFKHKDLKLYVGNIVSFHKDNLTDLGFLKSAAGKWMKHDIINEIQIEIIEKDGGEIQFLVYCLKGGRKLKESELDGSNSEDIYYEISDYSYLRYLNKNFRPIMIKQ